MDVDILPGARQELNALRDNSVQEHNAMLRAIEKLQLFGINLPFPWVSHIRGTDLWELRPLSGRSAWRAIYKRVSNVLCIAAIGPDAKVDKKAFNAAVERAASRLRSQ